MQKYQSHKVVEAAKIKHAKVFNNVEAAEDQLNIMLESEDDASVAFDGRASQRILEISRDHGGPVGGYYILYPDGYQSWSPPEAFEEGYRPVGDSDVHPGPVEFTEEQLEADHILRYFHYAHLPDALAAISEPFCRQAHGIVTTLPRNPERTVALRKLLEAKDAAVRANV